MKYPRDLRQLLQSLVILVGRNFSSRALSPLVAVVSLYLHPLAPRHPRRKQKVREVRKVQEVQEGHITLLLIRFVHPVLPRTFSSYSVTTTVPVSLGTMWL